MTGPGCGSSWLLSSGGHDLEIVAGRYGQDPAHVWRQRGNLGVHLLEEFPRVPGPGLHPAWTAQGPPLTSFRPWPARQKAAGPEPPVRRRPRLQVWRDASPAFCEPVDIFLVSARRLSVHSR